MDRLWKYVGEAGIVLLYGMWLRQGYRARRPHWHARSWWRFAVLLCAAGVAVAVALRMAIGVDRGVYRGMSTLEARLYLWTMFGLLLGGIGGAVGLLGWFAFGDPTRQLGRSGHRPSRSAT